VIVHIFGLQKPGDEDALNGLDDYIKRVEKHHKEFVVVYTFGRSLKPPRSP
jgi:hypothetical protein